MQDMQDNCDYKGRQTGWTHCRTGEHTRKVLHSGQLGSTIFPVMAIPQKLVDRMQCMAQTGEWPNLKEVAQTTNFCGISGIFLFLREEGKSYVFLRIESFCYAVEGPAWGFILVNSQGSSRNR